MISVCMLQVIDTLKITMSIRGILSRLIGKIFRVCRVTSLSSFFVMVGIVTTAVLCYTVYHLQTVSRNVPQTQRDPAYEASFSRADRITGHVMKQEWGTIHANSYRLGRVAAQPAWAYNIDLERIRDFKEVLIINKQVRDDIEEINHDLDDIQGARKGGLNFAHNLAYIKTEVEAKIGELGINTGPNALNEPDRSYDKSNDMIYSNRANRQPPLERGDAADYGQVGVQGGAQGRVHPATPPPPEGKHFGILYKQSGVQGSELTPLPEVDDARKRRISAAGVIKAKQVEYLDFRNTGRNSATSGVRIQEILTAKPGLHGLDKPDTNILDADTGKKEKNNFVVSGNAEKTYQVESENVAQNWRVAERDQPTYKLYIAPNGRLGNLMFQYASIYGLAKSTKRRAVLGRGFSFLTHVFGNISIALGEIPNNVTEATEHGAGYYSHIVYRSLPNTDVKVCCFLQSWKYFYQSEADLRRHFTLRDNIADEAKYTLYKLASSISKAIKSRPEHYTMFTIEEDTPLSQFTYVAVYIQLEDKKMGYKATPWDYIRNAMGYFRQKYRNVIFVVGSNDIKETMDHMKKKKDVVFVIDKTVSYYRDLAVLSLCNHTVVTRGTYSWWIGWMTGGEVVYYKDWLKNDSNLQSIYNTLDYFPPHWKAIQ